MAMSEAKRRANKKWDEANMKVKYDSIHLLVEKGKRDLIQEKAKEKGMTTSKYITEAIRSYMGEEEWAGGSDNLRPDEQENA